MKNKISLFEISLIILALRQSILFGIFLAAYVYLQKNETNKIKHDLFKLSNTLSEAADILSKNIEEQLRENYQSLDVDLKKRMSNLENQFKAMVKEEEEGTGIEEPKETPQKIIFHKQFTIEDYGGYYIVKSPEGEAFPKAFHNILHAKSKINQLAQNYEIPIKTKKGRQVQNIRFVR